MAVLGMCLLVELTEKQSLVWVPMDEPRHWRVGLFVQRIKRQSGMIGYHRRLSRDELAKNGIVARVSPVDTAQDIRAVANRISTFT